MRNKEMRPKRAFRVPNGRSMTRAKRSHAYIARDKVGITFLNEGRENNG